MTGQPVQDTDADAFSPGLYILATPIGNLGDITSRAVKVLAACDGVACEDTRVTGKLLRHLGLSKPMWRYDDHAGERDRARLVDSLGDRIVVLASDAGTPLVSDPGYRLVRDAQQAGHYVTTLPGPSAPIAALTLSGLPNDRFLFAGFLPNKDKARSDALNDLANVPATLIFFDTAPRLLKSLHAIDRQFPQRAVAVARELTKRYEECRRGKACELIDHYSANPPKGEIVLLIGPPVEAIATMEDADAMLVEALKTKKSSQAAAQVAKATGLDRKGLYARARELHSR